ncbi:CsbD family protein [Streptomyces sp. NBC_01089]|uniref:CsbD family protein n=1 Tax=Streptomyces sp. NBC_01089 TaxID=2903747 RepID=UPI0038700D16|nr:CsbD family protein [Streptomyces sp. NBC_01089]
MGDDSAMDKIKGKAKEAAGKMSGDKRQETEGKADQAKGKTKDTLGDAKDRAQGAKDSFTD